MWHSLYSTDGARQIIGGITEEIEQKLLARGEARLLGKTDKSVGCYLNVAALEIALDELVREANAKGEEIVRLIGEIDALKAKLAEAEDAAGRTRAAISGMGLLVE